MSTTDAVSTNDVSSTARSTAETEIGDDDSNLFSQQQRRGKGATSAVILTSDGIIKECIKQGFYRNPICNEKLYLHNKGYDSIAPSAFELYTDVKVLWLEGNALASLPCGGELIRVQPPRNKSALYSSSSSSSVCSSDAEAEGHEGEGKEAGAVEHHVDPFKGLGAGVGAAEELGEGKANPSDEHTTYRHHTHQSDAAATQLPAASDVPLEDRDAFSSLYPTVRQLYLHNNIFRTMPDLSRFERLDAVNLANNFFTRVEPHCPHWDRGLRDQREALEEEERRALGTCICTSHISSRKDGASMDAEEVRVVLTTTDDCNESESSSGNTAPDGNATGEDGSAVACLSPEEAKLRRCELLDKYKEQVEQHLSFCPHVALPDSSDLNKATLPSRRPVHVPRAYRNPCSSLRTLNLAANHIQAFEDLLGLLCYKALNVLDLSQNRITDGEALLLILERLEHLKSLKLSGNPLVRTLPRYRKTVLARCKALLHLDDRPVFADERRLVDAWASGGEAAEKEERAKIKAESDAAVRKRVDDFRKLLDTYRSNSTGETTSGEGEDTRAAAGAPRLDPSHQGYIDAITNHHHPAAAEEPEAARPRAKWVAERPNSDPDLSPTSSEEESGDEDGGKGGTALAAKGPTGKSGSPLAASAAAVKADRRVLSSNGNNMSSRSRKNVVVEVVEDEEDVADVFIPS